MKKIIITIILALCVSGCDIVPDLVGVSTGRSEFLGHTSETMTFNMWWKIGEKPVTHQHIHQLPPTEQDD